MPDGRLPLPRGRPTALVARAVKVYAQAYDPQRPLHRRRRAQAVLQLYLQAMTRDDLAHYYARVQQLRLAE